MLDEFKECWRAMRLRLLVEGRVLPREDEEIDLMLLRAHRDAPDSDR